MPKKTKERPAWKDLPNVIDSLKVIRNDKNKSKEVREMATDIAVFLIYLQVDLEQNNII